jgi:steroid delta-isomerase-like uncharacterized protein
MTTKTLNDVVAASAEAFNSHDPSAYAAVFAADAKVVDPFYPEPLSGRDAIRQDLADFQRAFPDAKIAIVTKLVDGERVAAEWEMAGTHTGPLATPDGEIAPTNRRFELRGCDFARANSAGQIVEERRYYDVAGLLGQLGIS